MAPARHKLERRRPDLRLKVERHKVERRRRLWRHVTRRGLSAAAVTALAGGAATAVPGTLPDLSTTGKTANTALPAKMHRTERAQPRSRSAVRAPVVPSQSAAPRVTMKPMPGAPKVVAHKYVMTALNMRTGPRTNATLLTVLPAGARVAVTGHMHGMWAEIVSGGQARWVDGAFLSDAKPGSQQPTPAPMHAAGPAAPPSAAPMSPPTPAVKPTTQPSMPGGFSNAPCADSATVEQGLVPNAVGVYRAVCAQFPSVTSYSGFRNDGSEHSDGTSLDVMVGSNTALGDSIASWLRQNAGPLHVREVIWAQHIWTVARGNEGWRLMPDLGSRTANHDNHVHVRVFN